MYFCKYTYSIVSIVQYTDYKIVRKYSYNLNQRFLTKLATVIYWFYNLLMTYES